LVVETIIEERQKAKAEFKKAVEEGKTAVIANFLGPEVQDLIRINLGAIPPRQEIILKAEIF
jgi:hypothetical protein